MVTVYQAFTLCQVPCQALRQHKTAFCRSLCGDFLPHVGCIDLSQQPYVMLCDDKETEAPSGRVLLLYATELYFSPFLCERLSQTRTGTSIFVPVSVAPLPPLSSLRGKSNREERTFPVRE